MTTPLTPAPVWGSSFVAPENGDPADATVVETVLQNILNRTEFLRQDGYGLWSEGALHLVEDDLPAGALGDVAFSGHEPYVHDGSSWSAIPRAYYSLSERIQAGSPGDGYNFAAASSGWPTIAGSVLRVGSRIQVVALIRAEGTGSGNSVHEIRFTQTGPSSTTLVITGSLNVLESDDGYMIIKADAVVRSLGGSAAILSIGEIQTSAPGQSTQFREETFNSDFGISFDVIPVSLPMGNNVYLERFNVLVS